MRIILITGKGGVGKTSVAAATAVGAGARGHNVLLASTDIAHSLADCFGKPVGPEPVPMTDRVDAVEIDTLSELRGRWDVIRRELAEFLGYLGYKDPILAEEIAVMPGMDEMFALSRLCELSERGAWDVIVVDCAPTGAALRLLSFADAAGAKYRRVLELAGLLFALAKPGARLLGVSPAVPSRSHLSCISSMIDEIARLHARLVRPREATVRLVLNPEKTVIAETRRTFTYMSLFGFSVDAVIANRVIPPQAGEGYWTAYLAMQQEHLRSVEESFLQVPVFRVPHYPREVCGMGALEELCEDLYGEADPAGVFAESAGMSTGRRAMAGTQVDVLEVPLPGVELADVHVRRAGGDLVISAGRWRRVLALPETLARRDVLGASFSDGVLTVAFDERPR